VERFAIVTCVVLLAACGSGDATPDANPDDLDGDGVQNAQDNCPMRANVDQHDEDADAVGDACDNCPTIANADQRDTTEAGVNMQSPDGVGDACDLRPALSGDHIASLSPFADPAEADRWTGSGWTIANDVASATSDAQWQWKKSNQGGGAILVAEISELALGSGGEVTLAVDGDGVNGGAACTLREPEQLIARDLAGGATAMTTVTITAPATLVTWRLVYLQGTETLAKVTCRVTSAGATHTVEAPLADSIVVGNQALVARAAMTAVSSLVLYTSPGPRTP
jgi:hypothetical protein